MLAELTRRNFVREREREKIRDRGRSRLRIENVSRKEAVTVIEGPWFDNLSPRLVRGDPRCNSRHSKGPVGLDQPFILLPWLYPAFGYRTSYTSRGEREREGERERLETGTGVDEKNEKRLDDPLVSVSKRKKKKKKRRNSGLWYRTTDLMLVPPFRLISNLCLRRKRGRRYYILVLSYCACWNGWLSLRRWPMLVYFREATARITRYRVNSFMNNCAYDCFLPAHTVLQNRYVSPRPPRPTRN